MSRGAWPILLLLLGYGLFEVSAIARSQHLFEPLRIFDDFVEASQAAERCEPADTEEHRRFEANLSVVRRRALDDLAESSPDASRPALEAQLSQRESDRRRAVDLLVSEHGCSGGEVWRLLKLHEQRARLRVK